MSIKTATFYFENTRLAQQIFHGETPNLKKLERHFNIKATARDNWVKTEGDEASVNRAQKVLELIEESSKNGIIIRAHDFSQALLTAERDGLEALRTLQSSRIYTSSKKPVVIPKTLSQKKYVDMIRNHDITFGVGPAGTGKKAADCRFFVCPYVAVISRFFSYGAWDRRISLRSICSGRSLFPDQSARRHDPAAARWK